MRRRSTGKDLIPVGSAQLPQDTSGVVGQTIKASIEGLTGLATADRKDFFDPSGSSCSELAASSFWMHSKRNGIGTEKKAVSRTTTKQPNSTRSVFKSYSTFSTKSHPISSGSML